MSLIGETHAGPGPGDLIKEGADATFIADVIEASKVQPVIVDFWATWCGPCKTLGPMLEAAVLEAGGAVKMVKIDIDRNPAYAQQLRVQSIPTVYAFKDGRPVDAFQGAVPASEVKAFVARLAGPPGAAEIEELQAMAKESLELNDLGGAAQAYAQILQLDPENAAAVGGLAKLHLAAGDPEQARQVLGMAAPDAKHPDIDSVRAALTLAEAAPSDTADFEQRLAKDENDHAARLELAKALAAHGRFEAASNELLTIIERDRDWDDGAARKQLLTVFEAAGLMSDVTKQGRRRLSSILFS